jgi:glycosyltransferase involved in cell wall biosynthesis
MSDTVRLLILTHNYPRFEGDFAGIFVALQARRLCEHGISPVVLAPHDPGAAEYEIVDGVTIYRFRYADSDADETLAYRGTMHQLVLGSVSGIFRFKRFLDSFRAAAFDIIRKERIDVVAGNWLVPSGIVMKSIAAKTDLPMILSSHGTDIRLLAKYLIITRRFFGKFFRTLHRWTMVSNFLRDEILKLEPAVADLVEVLPLPHDETIFYRDPSIARDPNMILAVTRFTDQKRVDFLINAFAMIAERNAEVHLYIYGSGPMQEQIEGLIRSLSLHGRITIHAPVAQTELRSVYNRAGMVVLNSCNEGFGLALSEAMMCGAAVIGTNSGGIVDIVRNNQTGLLVELDNSAALADAMMQLLNDEALRTRLADAGHQFAVDSYSSGPLAKRYAEIVKAAVQK